MTAASSHDALVLFLWLGLAVLLFARVEMPQPLAAPAPVPSLEAEAAQQQDQRDQPVLRMVSLPPPPAPSETQPQPEATEASPPPETLVRALRALPKPVVPLRPVEAIRAEEAVPPAPAGVPTQPLTPEGPVTAKPQVKEEPSRPSAAATAAPEQETESEVKPGQLEAQAGRTLLRLLEHGSGPEIELAWPDSHRERGRLYDRLQDCFGMRIAIMDSAGLLYHAQGGAFAPWSPNMDLYSGFMRRPSGRLTAPEESLLRSARGRVPSAGLLRLFTRRVDALLLGGLQALIGPSYGKLRAIHGRYRLRSGRVLIEGLEGDGRRFPGTIDLTPAAAGRCAHVAS